MYDNEHLKTLGMVGETYNKNSKEDKKMKQTELYPINREQNLQYNIAALQGQIDERQERIKQLQQELKQIETDKPLYTIMAGYSGMKDMIVLGYDERKEAIEEMKKNAYDLEKDFGDIGNIIIIKQDEKGRILNER